MISFLSPENTLIDHVYFKEIQSSPLKPTDVPLAISKDQIIQDIAAQAKPRCLTSIFVYFVDLIAQCFGLGFQQRLESAAEKVVKNYVVVQKVLEWKSSQKRDKTVDKISQKQKQWFGEGGADLMLDSDPAAKLSAPLLNFANSIKSVSPSPAKIIQCWIALPKEAKQNILSNNSL